jgi:hypothetical protein
MVMEIYGLTGQKAHILYEFPEREYPTTQLGRVDFKWADARHVNKAIDHLTYHSDGNFHITTQDRQDLYIHEMRHPEPLGPTARIFLDFKVVSEVACKYAPLAGLPEEPHKEFQVPDDETFFLEAAFSGSNYPLEKDIGGRVLARTGTSFVVRPMLRLASGTLKGCFIWYSRKIPENTLAGKPDGTFISFRFEGKPGASLIKGFFFS